MIRDYDIFLVGDDLSGFYVLERLAREESLPPLKVGGMGRWAGRPTIMPASIASHYGLKDSVSVGAPCFIRPKERVFWNESRRKEFPLLGDNHAVDKIQSRPTRRERVLWRESPRMKDYAFGAWQLLGRTQNVPFPASLRLLKQSTELVFCKPAPDTVPAENWIYPDDDLGRPTCIQKMTIEKERRIRLELSNGNIITTKYLILNDGLHELSPLFHPDFTWNQFFDIPHTTTSAALFPVEIRVRRELFPEWMPRLVMLYDTDDRADPNSEIWPLLIESMENEWLIQGWVTAAVPTSLEMIQSKAHRLIRRLNQEFPFMPYCVNSIWPTLSTDTCGDENLRDSLFSELEIRSLGRYRVAIHNSSTRVHNGYWLGAMLRSQEGSVVGTFTEAISLATSLAKRFRKVNKKNQNRRKDNPNSASESAHIGPTI